MRARVMMMPSPVGSGSLGSITKTVGIARLLKARGCDVRFAVGGRLAAFAKQSGFANAECPVPQFSRETRKIASIVDFIDWTGMADAEYVPRAVAREVDAIRAFKPHVIFAEARPTAAISAAITRTPLATVASWPMHPQFDANKPAAGQLCEIFNVQLSKYQLPTIGHVAELLFPRSDLKLSPSIPELEPELSRIPDVQFTGHMLDLYKDDRLTPTWYKAWITRPLIVVYMSVGAVAPQLYRRMLPEAFGAAETKVLCACGFHFGANHADLETFTGNVRFVEYVPLQNVIEECDLLLFHGGQDTMLLSLLHGVPSIAFPGQHFERKYNAERLAQLGASRMLPIHAFRRSQLRRVAEETMYGAERDKSTELGRMIAKYRGTDAAVDLIMQMAQGSVPTPTR